MNNNPAKQWRVCGRVSGESKSELNWPFILKVLTGSGELFQLGTET